MDGEETLAATKGVVDARVPLSGTIGAFPTSAGAVDIGVAFATSAVDANDGVSFLATTVAVDGEVA